MDTQLHDGRLHRSRSDRVLFGVCSGLGDYFEVDPTLIRLGFVLVTLAGGAGLLAYIVLAIVMPEAGSAPLAGREALHRNVRQLRTNAGELAGGQRANPDDPFGGESADLPSRRQRTGEFGAFMLIAIGLLFLAVNLGWLAWVNWGNFWPVLLIVLGVVLLIQRAGRAR